jgi:hypothetical protein
MVFTRRRMVQDIRRALDDTLAPEIRELKAALTRWRRAWSTTELLANVILPRF